MAAPLIFMVAGIAVALLGNTPAQFTRVLPSAGSFITFVGKAFGASGVVTSVARRSRLHDRGGLGPGRSGGFLSIVVNYYFKWNVPWGIWSLRAHRGPWH